MKDVTTAKEQLQQGEYTEIMGRLYPTEQQERQIERHCRLLDAFGEKYGSNRQVGLYSAPGRTEIGGNHTDHQHGRVLAAAVDLDIICAASKNNDNVIRIQSEGYKEDVVELDSLQKRASEENKAISLIRGIAARCRELGYQVGGFDAYTTSNVLKGSGLSSSAAFEVAIGTMISHLFNHGGISPVEIAQIGQYAENHYFGKPSGLMDQMASSVGGFVAIDFADPEKPVVEPVAFDFSSSGLTLCIVDTRGDHADLTGEYAAITQEMKQVAAMFGGEYLRQVDPGSFYERLDEVRIQISDRAALRAIHFFSDNDRVPMEVAALKSGDVEAFKRLVIESGRSSFTCLQNIFSTQQPKQQGLSLALAVSEMLLSPKGAWRVHGGGFAGTIQAFVPGEILPTYQAYMDKVFGQGACHQLSFRPLGGCKIAD